MKSTFSLGSKVVVVTGGAGLLGASFVRSIVLAGGKVVIAEKDIVAAKRVVADIQSLAPDVEIGSVEIDITNKSSVASAVEQVVTKYGKVDALVNNAYPRNRNYGKHFFEVSYEDFAENLSMNLGGYFLTSQVFAEQFKKQGFGNIVNVSSIYGVIAPKFEVYDNTSMTMPVEYCAIKSGLLHLTKYMAKYFKGLNIRVNALSPGGILDKQDENFVSEYNKHCLTKGMLSKDDISGAFIFLLSDASSFVNGQNIIVDDGFTL